jgi:monovalent cation/hydrogen antiporter
LIFLVNGIIFILIGLQLPLILDRIQDHSLGDLIWYGVLISLATILVRIAWVFPGAYIPRWLSKRIRQAEPDTNAKMVTIVAWSGMRGVVSLAAALALPLTVGEGIPFPNRELIIFITFCVIFSTLVLQGLSLPGLIRWLKLKPDNREHRDDQEARLRIASEVVEHIEANYSLGLSLEVLNQIKTKYEMRIQRISRDANEQKLTESQILEFLRIQRELIHVERKAIKMLRKGGTIGEEVLRKLEHELDLEESRLMLEWEG